MGVPIVDADQTAHQLTGPGGEAMPEILDAFGPELLSPDGSLHRARMRELVFHDPSQRSRLEAILHPRIQSACLRALAASTAPYTIYDVPLWAEGAGQHRPDWVWKVVVIDLSPDLQRQRVMARQAMEPGTLDRILALQAPREARLALADEVITNDSSLMNLERQVMAAHARWMSLCAETVGPDPVSNQT
jgi:dephospho-CoA kinase